MLALLLGLAGCKGNDDVTESAAPGMDAEKKIRVQFSYSARYSQETKAFYVVTGEHARIPIGYNVIISVPKDELRKFKVIITPKSGADPLEGVYETSAETFNKDYKEHVIMINDLRHVYSVYAKEAEASCQVYDVTDKKTLIFEGTAMVEALEARELELIALEVKDTTISAEVTHYNDMKYEWRMDNSGANQLPPQKGDMGWSSEGFVRREDTNIAVTIYDDQGRFNNFLFIYPQK
jgi:hypothetical protein